MGLLLLGRVGDYGYAVATSSIALGTFVVLRGRRMSVAPSLVHPAIDAMDLFAIVGTYALVLVFYRVAFKVVAADMVLFAFFGGGLIVGVCIPVIYTVWVRQRPLGSLGLSRSDLPRTALLAVIFAGVQFAMTFLGYDMPRVRDWLPLLGMALMVGLFESIFFRGFVQGRLEAAFGPAVAVFGAAALYGLYHVGYGMGVRETVFLFGLGVVYALAYQTTRNVLVLWPLLVPMGSLFAQIDSGELLGRLPWASLLGFADVMAVFAFILWRATRRERRALVN